MRCIIVEDQPPAQRILKKYIQDFGKLELIGTFSSPVEAAAFIRQESVDLMFLDIHLPHFSGMELLNILPSRPALILTTAYSEYALEGFNQDAVDYLLKPFSFDRFVQAVSKVPDPSLRKRGEKESARTEIFIKSGHDYLKIRIADILYIHSDSDYTEIWTARQRLLSSEPLKYWRDTLKDNRFTQTHKSYLVNPQAIEKVSGNEIYMTDGHRVPIGRAYKEGFMKEFVGKG